MADLTFIYSVMGAGKSAHLLQNEYQYHKKGFNTLLLTNSVDTRWGTGQIITRFGYSKEGKPLSKEAHAVKHIKKTDIMTKFPKTDVIFVDEVQFFNKKSILALADIVTEYEIDVFCYGLKVDSNGNMWPGAKALFECAGRFKTIDKLCTHEKCKCLATHILRYDSNGDVVRNGPQIHVGDLEYRSVCFQHWKAEYYQIKR